MRACLRVRLLLCCVGAGLLGHVRGQACTAGTFHSSGEKCSGTWSYISGVGRCVGKFNSDLKTYAEAQAFCQGGDAHLKGIVVLPESNNENEDFHWWKPVSRRVKLWIGSTKVGNHWIPAIFKMDFGQPPWAPGEPNNHQGSERCVIAHGGGLWNDEGCGDKFPTYCERPWQCGACTTTSCGHGNFRPPCTTTADTECAACAAHTYGEETRTATCTATCPAGKRVNDAKSECADCVAGKFSAAAAATCTDCRLNSWSGVGWGHCNCNAGFEDVSGTCRQCAVGQFSTSGGACTECGAGRTDTNGFTGCRYCAVGFTSPHAGGCSPCPRGKSSSWPFTHCEWCGDFTTSSGEGGSCSRRQCVAGSFAPIDNVALANHWDHDCEPCPYNSFSVFNQTSCSMCSSGQVANDAKTSCVPCADEHFNIVFAWSERGVMMESEVESHVRWPWLTVGDLRSVRTPCTCASGRLVPIINDNIGQSVMAACTACPVGRVDHSSLLRLPSKENELRYGEHENELYDASVHFGLHEVCEECPAGSRYTRHDGADVNHCELCPAGSVQPRAGEPECVPCLSGRFANTTGQTACLECALCPEGQFRRGCGRLLRDSEGACESCLIDCPEGEMATACINRRGVSSDPPKCKRKEFLTRTPLCQSNRDGNLRDRGLGLGGFDFETIFAASELEVPFQCSRVCDAQGGPIDTMTCDGPFACNRMSCTMESSYLNTDLNDFRVARACPVELSDEESLNPLAHIDVVTRKRLVTCQKCAECGSTPPHGAQGLLDWGRGCVRECSLVECLPNEIYDWTDHTCKLCSQLSNASLCTYAESQAEELATQDVSGNRPKLLLLGCRAKQNREQEALTYGSCKSCRSSAQDCSSEAGLASYHAGCNEGCQPCLHRQNLVLSSAFKYIAENSRTMPLYCQVSECSTLQPDGTPRTGLKDMGSMCGAKCDTAPCPAGMLTLECSLPHDTRCFAAQPLLRAAQIMRSFTPAHANLLEHADSARFHFSNFENTLVNVKGAAQNLHQCVWNAVDVRDNDMNPAGISWTFFPPAHTYAEGLTEYGSKFCHRWTRNRALVYPMLPLQNTVSFPSAFPRRLLLNASARVLHYDYSGDGFAVLPSVAEMPRPSRFLHVFAGDLYLSIDLTNTPNASLQVFVPDDRRLHDARWIPSVMISALVADSTARSTVSRPELTVHSHMVSRLPRSSLRVGLEFDSSNAVVVMHNFQGVHCEMTLCRFAVSMSHALANGSAWVSRNNVSASDSVLAQVFPEMTLASAEVSGGGEHARDFVLAPSQHADMGNRVFSRLASVMHSATCPLLLVANDMELVCLTLSSNASEFHMHLVNLSDVRLESRSTVLSVGTRREESLTLFSLSADFGQQLLLHHHDSGRTLDVQYLHQDVVALACGTTDGSTWLLRKVAALSAHQFVLLRAVLVTDYSLGDTGPRLLPDNVTQADLLTDMFENRPDIALSPQDTYTLTASTSKHLFVVFSFVPAQHRFLSLLHDNGERIVELCSLLSEYPGLNQSYTSSAWTSHDTLVVHMQHNIFTVSCDGSRLVLRHEPEALPNNAFTQYMSSYVSLLGQRHVRLSSNLRGANLAVQPSATGYCVFVSSPETNLTITQLPNAYLRDVLVVLDPQFDTEQLVLVNSLGGLEAVHSLRMLGDSAVFVTIQPQGTPVLHTHALFAHMRHLHLLGVERGVFWNTTKAHLMELQISLPCAGHASSGAGEFRARQDSNRTCAEACVVLHLTVVESWDAYLDTSWHTHAGTAYVKDAQGLRQFAVTQHSLVRLYNGAKLVRTTQVSHFSSVQFSCDTADNVDTSLGWQRASQVVSAHNLRPREALMLQVVRADNARESLSSARSLAVDALQMLVVLTTGVVSVVLQDGITAPVSRQPSTVTGWISHAHCCGPETDIFFGVCPLIDNYVINTKLACALMTELDGVVCFARSYVEITESCHCHTVCDVEHMRTVLQSGVALMIGVVANFCPSGMHPTDVSLADTTHENCEADQNVSTVPAEQSIFPARRLLEAVPAAQAYFAAMYLPTEADLAQIDLGDVLYGSNNAHTDNWQRIFVLVGMRKRVGWSATRGCEFRIRLAGLSSDNTVMERAANSRLFELGCTLQLDERGSGECVLEVPTSLAVVSAHRRVALTAEVTSAAEQGRCEWPDQDLFTAALVPYLSHNTCEHDQFWSEDSASCVPCEMANSELTDNVCGPGAYIRGCDAISHLDSNIVQECQLCVNADHNAADSYEWLTGICQWQCANGFYLDTSVRCEACTSDLVPVCGMVAGMRYQACSREDNEACVKCDPILRGLYSANEVFVAAVHGGAECQSECRAGHYRRDESCRVCASVPNLQLSLDLQFGAARRVFYRFEACSGALDTTAVQCEMMQNGQHVGDASATGVPCAYRCDAGFHAIDGLCVDCTVPRGFDGLELSPAAYAFTDTDCSFECRTDAHYLKRNGSDGRNASCVLCNASMCGVGTYLAGVNCTECRGCERMSLVNGIFSSHGQVDAPGSCAEECALGFFADFERCVEHSTVTCLPAEYQMPGTASVDVMCLPCSDCRGLRLVSPCEALRNSVCEPCGALGANEEYADYNCSAVCLPGALRDATGVCEMCAEECLAGTFRDFSGALTCMQCAPCPPLRANSNYTDECSWTCNQGYTMMGNASLCVPEPPTMVMRVAAPEVQVQCNASEFRVGGLECRSCAELNVVTPAAEGLGVRWRWSRWSQLGAGLCEFECLTPYILFVGVDGSKFCYTPEEYSAHLRLLHTELFRADEADGLPSRPMRQARQKKCLTILSFVFCI